MDDKRKRFVARMAELGYSRARVDREAGLPQGATRDFLGDATHDPQEPSVDRAAKFAHAVGWTLQQFSHGSNKIGLRLRVNGVSRGRGMWSSIADRHSKIVPIDLPVEDIVSIEISAESEAPQLGFRAGDIIVGSKTSSHGLGNVVHSECIICAVDGRQLLGVLHPGSKRGRYNVQPFNPRDEPITDLEIEWAAPIHLIVRGRN